MVLSDYPHRRGLDWEVATVGNMLAFQGVRNPATGEPFSETWLLGLGGGVGGGYFVFEMCGGVWTVIGFRRAWEKYKGEFTAALCPRIGVRQEVFQSGSKKAAQEHMLQALEAGKPTWCATAEAVLPFRHLPIELAKGLVYGVAVVGVEGDQALLDDRAESPWRVALDVLAESRATMPATKSLAFTLEPTGESIDLAAAVRAGVRQCVDEALRPPIRNFGLSAWDKWADLLVDRKDRKGWPTLFPTLRALGNATISTYREIAASGGDGMRRMYATFLREASVLPGLGALSESAEDFDMLGEHWEAFGRALIPESARVRDLIARRQTALSDPSRGDEAREVSAELDREAKEYESQVDLEELSEALRTIAKFERARFERLEAALA